ncbi:hypothetical protein PtA15_9A63 [Puccinia triticina]|uniref:DNA 3'-5' helicase n=1 Tax=Puccinia triticina TaxID=208348 RepID=A0ABY7CTH1_9BASI|nr:uncharacterized protein PtA15_9A63 [Puccinia triticina]WAQ87939.1 hypothetical protein PtA15_9A63 [Puccinia triticina]WAR60130.1 hypothetical protein PtB15_9B67 [Puccinia triticina]
MDAAEPSWLSSLNQNQLKAVQRPADGSLQILAGPGSGKTRVLTYRIAYLLRKCGISPPSLVAVTFTNKSAKEMQNRLAALIGGSLVSEVILGTFHGMCVTFLRKHGTKIGLRPNWVICDRDQQLQYGKTALKDPQFSEEVQDQSIKPKAVVEAISKAKSQGFSPEETLRRAETPYQKLMAMLYRSYIDLLYADNCLDFDDLLLLGEKLFRSHPAIIAHIEHVLIDEFQDTNTVQYEIMRLLAHRGAVTVVGDPDQGIYGFRYAQAINLEKMTKDFPGTQVALLEENYRSSSSILKASLAVVQQDNDRIDKNLYTSHPRVSLPMARPFANPIEEAAFIAQEIHRLVAHTGGQLDYNDFCILMRYNALSRNLETALKTARIPVRMIGAQKFFERVEVKDILAYLQLADNPTFSPAFERVINTPRRKLGLAAITAVKAASLTHKISQMEVIVQAVRGKRFDGIQPAQTETFKKFLSIICNIQAMAQEGSPVADIIDHLVERINYADHLQKTYGPDAVQRDQNIQELKAFATHLAQESRAASNSQPLSPVKDLNKPPAKAGNRPNFTMSDADLDRLEAMFNMDHTLPDDIEEITPLRQFLVESSLSTDTDTQESKDDNNQPRVTITTCHSSKGLEWPVVFVIAVEDGIFPFYRCSEPEEIKEERRLLFVAMTRAQGLLYLTHAVERMQGAETRSQEVSCFLKKLLKQGTTHSSAPDCTFTQQLPEVDSGMLQELSTVIGRPAAPDKVIKNWIEDYDSKERKTFSIPDPSARRSSYPGSSQESKQNYNRWGKNRGPASLGRFSTPAVKTAVDVPPRGSFRTKSGPATFTSAAHYDPNAQASSSNKPVISGTTGKFSTPALRTLSQPTPQVKVSALHKPFVPPRPQLSSQESVTVKTEEPPSSSCPPCNPATRKGGLDRLKAISQELIADLKDNIPEGLFDDISDFEDPIKPEPSTSKSDAAPGRKRRKAAGRPTKSKKKTPGPAKKK